MGLYEQHTAAPEVHTTELDWPEQGRADGWGLSQGQWQHEDRGDDGEWVYLGDGVWADTHIASLTVDERRALLEKCGDALTATAAAIRQERAREQRRDQ